MKDEEFDKLLKKQMKSDTYIPEKIDKLFSDFGKNKIDDNHKVYKFRRYLKSVSIAACAMLVIFVGGCTYAHVNGTKTIISPILSKLGINSKYEESSTKFNDEVVSENVKIKLKDGAIDDTTLILGYEIEIANSNPDIWLEIIGEYEINGMKFEPVNSTVDKISDGEYVYYQVFDVSEIMIDNPENVYISSKISEIKEYTECENENSAYPVYGDSLKGEWNFDESISVKNLEENKKYEFNNPQKYEIAENVNVFVAEFIKGSYTNILKIKVDKTNYTGDDFEKYYKVLDDKNNEIAMYNEEQREYDDRVYNDRLVSEKIKENSKIKMEIYFKESGKKEFNKVITIPIDLSKAIEKIESQDEWKEYDGDDYGFKYNSNWKVTTNLGKDKLGENSIYLGALGIEIPSTTNSEYTSSIYVKTVNKDITLDEYAEERREINNSSESGGYNEIENAMLNLKNNEGYQIIYETSDGSEKYIYENVFIKGEGKIYDISFFGSDKEYNNLKSDIDKFINSFEIK